MNFIFSAYCPRKECRKNGQVNCLECPNCGSTKFKKCRDTNILTCKNCRTNLSSIPCQECGTKVRSSEYETMFSRLMTLVIAFPFTLILGGVITAIIDNALGENAPYFAVEISAIFFCLIFPCFITFAMFRQYTEHRRAIITWQNHGSEV